MIKKHGLWKPVGNPNTSNASDYDGAIKKATAVENWIKTHKGLTNKKTPLQKRGCKYVAFHCNAIGNGQPVNIYKILK